MAMVVKTAAVVGDLSGVLLVLLFTETSTRKRRTVRNPGSRTTIYI